MAIWLLSAILLIGAVHGSQWAVLVAGSNGYWNYRHQADVCHAYDILISQGVPASHIILLSFNDVFNSSSNPFPGHLYNAPGHSPQDVYAGCVVDYQGYDNNSTTFLAVLTGNKSAVAGVGTERVLESTVDDTVFVYFVDHGAPGIVAFPNDILYADQFNAALQQMTDKGLYGKMVLFLDACYGGSMFDGILPSNTGIYAVTAANDTEMSWGIYCPEFEDVVDGQKMFTCLADMFSNHWMDVVTTSNLATTSLSEIYTAVTALTNLSHVSEYGDLSVSSELIGTFFGEKSTSVQPAPEPLALNPSWMGYDVKYQYFAYKYLVEPTVENAQALIAEVTSRSEVSTIFAELMGVLSPDDPLHFQLEELPVTDFDCLRAAVTAYANQCQPVSEFAMRYFLVLKNACEEGFAPAIIEQQLQNICSQERKQSHTIHSAEEALEMLKGGRYQLGESLWEEVLVL